MKLLWPVITLNLSSGIERGVAVGEGPCQPRSAADFLVEPSDGVVGAYLFPVPAGKVHACYDLMHPFRTTLAACLDSMAWTILSMVASLVRFDLRS